MDATKPPLKFVQAPGKAIHCRCSICELSVHRMTKTRLPPHVPYLPPSCCSIILGMLAPWLAGIRLSIHQPQFDAQGFHCAAFPCLVAVWIYITRLLVCLFKTAQLREARMEEAAPARCLRLLQTGPTVLVSQALFSPLPSSPGFRLMPFLSRGMNVFVSHHPGDFYRNSLTNYTHFHKLLHL